MSGALALVPHVAEKIMLEEEGFVQVKEAAKLLGVSPNTVRAWGAERKIPEYRHPVNNYRMYKRVDLERVLTELENSLVSASRPVARRSR